MRLSGFATGMDINQMVTDLMRAERMPMDRMKQDQQQMEWKMDQYRQINVKLDQFRTSIFDTILRRSNMMAKSASSSNEQLIKATATASAGEGTFRISEVKSLATAATNASTNEISSGDKIDPTKKLADQNFRDETFWKTGVVNRQVVTVDQKHTNIDLNTELGNPDSVVVRVNGVSYQVVEAFGEGDIRATQVMVNKGTGTDGKDELEFASAVSKGARIEVTDFEEVEGGKDTFTTSEITTYNANGQEVKDTFVITDNQTMNDVIKQMNSSSTGINVFYDAFSDKVSVSRTQTGNYNEGGNEMTFSGDFFSKALSLNNANEQGGTNAVFTVNGLETHRQSNTFTMNGVTMTLQGTFEAGTNSVTIGASTNVDKVMDTIKSFVEEYNELVDMVNEKTGEEYYRDYRPLTDDQKDAMTDREIERWEEKAMSGLLRNDRTLRSGFNTFRMDMYSPVQGLDANTLNQIAQIGITTTNNFRDGGKLEINEDKLRKAIESDPEAVYQLFAADGPTHADKGLARRVRASADGLIDRLSRTAGGMRGRNLNHQFTLGREMNNLEDRISNFERRMQQVEQRYWSQFNAMEKAIAQSNAQAESLFAQLYSGM
ncbi:flagellar filament capping protein FliD [Salipaludibacillus daqingensis]|uniref:flagellar filament capping protein FliD n=1 Tax=Salipaludibacillus daqingensis TaxID=3041001 RepID=UPI002472FB23|nr:flagellar filament capping protein FliD [Salipaludibacillus daqingensis]